MDGVNLQISPDMGFGRRDLADLDKFCGESRPTWNVFRRTCSNYGRDRSAGSGRVHFGALLQERPFILAFLIPFLLILSSSSPSQTFVSSLQTPPQKNSYRLSIRL